MTHNLFSALDHFRTDFPDALAALDQWQSVAHTRRERFLQDQANLLLSIGVMGQVKAGKSSFLNMLLFGGQPLLPEAATPKTANLTRIRYATQASLTAYFYLPEEWAKLEQLAALAGTDMVTKAAHELVAQAHVHHGQVSTVLAQQSQRIQAASVDELLGRINDYVGADGRLTPLVKNCELCLPLPELEGIEIVDTPGMNDPIISRTDKTRDYMAQCDVVFFLSQVGKFLDGSDQQLMVQQLPQGGVKRLLLVAAQFDSALLGEGHKYASLAAIETRTCANINRKARKDLDALILQRQRTGHVEAAALLQAIDLPHYTSSFAQAFATLPPAQWSAGQRLIHQRFTEMAQDHWGGQAPSREDWLRLGGFAALNTAMTAARADKEAILNTQRNGLERELAQGLFHLLSNLREQASERLVYLQNHDIADLDTRARQAQQQVNTIAAVLGDYVHQASAKARVLQGELANELTNTASRAQRLDERTGYTRESYSVSVSDAVWYNPFTWFSSHNESCYETSTYTYLATSDAVENLRGYVETARRQLLNAFGGLITPESISAGLRRELVRVLDMHSKDFDPRTLRALIDTAIGRLDLPQLDFDAPDTSATFAGFSGEVKNAGEMAALREKLTTIINEINLSLSCRLQATVASVCNELDVLARQLHATLTQSLAEDLDRLRVAMADKTLQIERLQELVQQVSIHAPAAP